MRLRNTKAFVLRTYPLQEADTIGVFFTHQYGKVRGVARSAKKPRSRYGAALEPLAEVQLSYIEKEGRELVTVRDCELIRSIFEIGRTPEGEAIIHYLAELVDLILPPHEPNEKVYRLLGAITECLDEPVERWPRVVLYAEVWLLKLAGFFPSLDHCTRCGQVIPMDREVSLSHQGRPECSSCAPSAGGTILAPLLRQEIAHLFTQPPRFWVNRDFDSGQMRPLHKFLRGYLGHVLEVEVKAGRFMKF